MSSLLWRVLTNIGGVMWSMTSWLLFMHYVTASDDLGVFKGLALRFILWYFEIGITVEEVVAFRTLIDESAKIVREVVIQAEEDEKQREARHAALVRWHGDKIYFFGDVSLSDAVTMWWAVDTLADMEMVASVFEVTGEAAVIL